MHEARSAGDSDHSASVLSAVISKLEVRWQTSAWRMNHSRAGLPAGALTNARARDGAVRPLLQVLRRLPDDGGRGGRVQQILGLSARAVRHLAASAALLFLQERRWAPYAAPRPWLAPLPML